MVDSWWLLLTVGGCCQLDVGVWHQALQALQTQVPPTQLVPLALMLQLLALLSRLRFLLVLGAELAPRRVALFSSLGLVEHLLPADGGLQ